MKLLRRQELTPPKNMTTFVRSSQFYARSTPTSSSSVRSRLFDRERLNLESHQLVGCDIHILGDLTEDTTLAALRQIVDYTKLFGSGESCKHYLQETQHIVSFLICSDKIGEHLIPEIHHFHNIRSIYVYSQNSEYHQQWPSQYTKVKLKQNSLVAQDSFYCRSDKFTPIANPYFRHSIVT